MREKLNPRSNVRCDQGVEDLPVERGGRGTLDELELALAIPSHVMARAATGLYPDRNGLATVHRKGLRQ
ncbi:MAG: DUF834 domain-containing protein [Myxococcales bacterium]|nr:DUF834 domain-containing protein [Myxococcales bacterium]